MIRRIRRHVRTHREGQTLAIMAVSIVALLALMSLGIDLGMAYTAHAEAQRVADAAALAGASVYLEPDPTIAKADERARDYAAMNVVRNRPVDRDADVMVQVLPAESKVRVRVERRDLPTWFARFVGFDDLTVSADAAAAVFDHGTADCLKPWAVVDLFDIGETRAPQDSVFDPGNDLHRYEPNTTDAEDPTGYGSGGEADIGMPMIIKAQDPNDPAVPKPGIFLPIQIPNDPTQEECFSGGGGGAEYRNDICSCNKTPISIDDSLSVEPGNMVGPTNQGVKALIDQDPGLSWNDQLDRIEDLDGNEVTESPRIMKMILIGPDQITSSGMQKVTVTNIAKFFIEEINNEGEVIGRFFGPVTGADDGGGMGQTTSPIVKILRLIE